MRSRNSWSSSSFSRSRNTSTDSSRISATFMPFLPRRLGRCLLSEAGRELGLDRQFRRSEVHRLARFDLGDAFHLEHDPPRPDTADPLLGRAFALAHSGFLRLLRNRLVGEDTDPDL